MATIKESVIDEYFEEKKELHPIWEELTELRNSLKQYDIAEVRVFIKENLESEIEAIQEEFNKDFEFIPKDSSLRLEILQTLGELGISIY